jgi:hypothetical protein
VKIRRHINKGKIVIYTEHYGEIFYCTGRPHFAISKPDFYMNERKCIFFCIKQFKIFAIFIDFYLPVS